MAFDEKKFNQLLDQRVTNVQGFNEQKFQEQIQKTGLSTQPRRRLETSQDFYNLAVQNGLKSQADRILASQKGEETKKIFSGGFISDIFDVLNSAQYGVVGVLKGKSFAEGVRTRQSFSDKDALGDKGLPGVVGGILLDIAVDPFTYVAPWTIVKKISPLRKAAQATKAAIFGKKIAKAIGGAEGTYEALEGGTKLGKYLAQKTAWMFGADPVFRETFERGLKNTAVETQNVVELVKDFNKIDPTIAKQILKRDETGRFVRVGLKELSKTLTPEQIEVVSAIYNKIDDLGKQAVDLKLLSKEAYEQNVGEYIKNAYLEYEQAKSKGIFGFAKQGIKGIKKRIEGLSPEKMKELGQIENPSYLLFKSGVDLAKDVENAKMLRAIDQRFGTEVAQEGFEQIPKGVKWGELAGKYVPKHMKEYLTEVVEPSTKTIGKELVANFKFFKVVMNPATHARNIMSNKILNYWKLGMNPLNPRTIDADITAIKEIAKGAGKYMDEAKPLGYNLDTFASQELKYLLDTPDVNAWGKAVKGWDKTKKYLGDIYQQEENYAKLSAYIYQRKVAKLNPEDAWKAAESATFNYAQVTPFVRKLRESLFGFPFITFTAKATPLAIETAVKAPQRISVFGKIKNAIEQQSDIQETDKEKASNPPWVRNGFYVKLPIKDKQGRSAYLDLTYIMPFGDLTSGQFFERGTSRETGLPEGPAQAALRKSPFFSLVGELAKNNDFYGNQIWRESDSVEKQMGDLMRHITKTYIPPLLADQLPGGYNEKGERQQRGFVGATKADEENQKRNLAQEIMRQAGVKIQPIDADIQETYQEWNKKKGLQNMLRENGILKEFNTFYQPK